MKTRNSVKQLTKTAIASSSSWRDNYNLCVQTDAIARGESERCEAETRRPTEFRSWQQY